MKNNRFSWLDRKEYPFASRYFRINNHALHYIDEGVGEPIVFIHGTPSWSFDFRRQITGLRTTHRCIAIDHMGFGLSDKAEHYDYSTQNHALTLECFLLEQRLENITLVVHDFGGPIGFHFALKHPEKIKRIVVLNSWLWDNSNEPEFKRLSRILKSPLLPFLYRNLNFSPRFILPKSFGDQKIDNRLLKQYTKPFANKTERNGTLAFARSLLSDQQWFEELWMKRHILSDKHITFIWGMKDPVISLKYLEKFTNGFPETSVHMLSSTGHFPQEESAEEVLYLLRKTLES